VTQPEDTIQLLADAVRRFVREKLVPAEPQVVTITGVARALIPMAVYTGGTQRLHLVPAYRFTGRFESGESYEATVLALHDDAIAPPPDAVSPVPPDAPTKPGAEPGREPMVDPAAPEVTTSPKG